MKAALWKSVILSSIMVLGGPALLAADADPAPNGLPAVRIRLFKYAGLPARALDSARKTVNKIFLKAGLEADWHECATDPGVRAQDLACMSTLGPDEFGIRLMARFEGSEKMFKLGDAHGRFVTLYLSNIEQMAQATVAEREVVLACVIAHELGHLLLGTSAHSGQGIMSTGWDRESMRQAARGNLLFTADESEFVRNSVRQRMAFRQQQLAAAAPASAT